MTVGEKIRKFRIDQGYTQKELAIICRIEQIGKCENMNLGIVFHHQNNYEKIANSLKIESIRHV